MKMYGMGNKPSATCSSDNLEEVYYPTTYINSDKIPHVADYDVGDEVEVMSICKVKSKNITETDEGAKTDVCLETIEMGISPHGDTKKAGEMGTTTDRAKDVSKRMGY